MRSVLVFAIVALVAAGVVPRYYVSMNGATAAAPAARPRAPKLPPRPRTIAP